MKENLLHKTKNFYVIINNLFKNFFMKIIIIFVDKQYKNDNVVINIQCHILQMEQL